MFITCYGWRDELLRFQNSVSELERNIDFKLGTLKSLSANLTDLPGRIGPIQEDIVALQQYNDTQAASVRTLEAITPQLANLNASVMSDIGTIVDGVKERVRLTKENRRALEHVYQKVIPAYCKLEKIKDSQEMELLLLYVVAALMPKENVTLKQVFTCTERSVAVFDRMRVKDLYFVKAAIDGYKKDIDTTMGCMDVGISLSFEQAFDLYITLLQKFDFSPEPRVDADGEEIIYSGSRSSYPADRVRVLTYAVWGFYAIVLFDKGNAYVPRLETVWDQWCNNISDKAVDWAGCARALINWGSGDGELLRNFSTLTDLEEIARAMRVFKDLIKTLPVRDVVAFVEKMYAKIRDVSGARPLNLFNDILKEVKKYPLGIEDEFFAHIYRTFGIKYLFDKHMSAVVGGMPEGSGEAFLHVMDKIKTAGQDERYVVMSYLVKLNKIYNENPERAEQARMACQAITSRICQRKSIYWLGLADMEKLYCLSLYYATEPDVLKLSGISDLLNAQLSTVIQSFSTSAQERVYAELIANNLPKAFELLVKSSPDEKIFLQDLKSFRVFWQLLLFLEASKHALLGVSSDYSGRVKKVLIERIDTENELFKTLVPQKLSPVLTPLFENLKNFWSGLPATILGMELLQTLQTYFKGTAWHEKKRQQLEEARILLERLENEVQQNNVQIQSEQKLLSDYQAELLAQKENINKKIQEDVSYNQLLAEKSLREGQISELRRELASFQEQLNKYQAVCNFAGITKKPIRVWSASTHTSVPGYRWEFPDSFSVRWEESIGVFYEALRQIGAHADIAAIEAFSGNLPGQEDVTTGFRNFVLAVQEQRNRYVELEALKKGRGVANKKLIGDYSLFLSKILGRFIEKHIPERDRLRGEIDRLNSGLAPNLAVIAEVSRRITQKEFEFEQTMKTVHARIVFLEGEIARLTPHLADMQVQHTEKNRQLERAKLSHAVLRQDDGVFINIIYNWSELTHQRLAMGRYRYNLNEFIRKISQK